jgi:hypothetical protein
MPDFKAVVFVEGQLPFNVANAFDAVNSAFDGQCWVMFLHNVLGRKIYPTLLRPRTFIHNSFSMISSQPEGLPKSPRPRLFKLEWASNILLQSFDFRKKHFYTWCAGLIVHALLTLGGGGGFKFFVVLILKFKKN